MPRRRSSGARTSSARPTSSRASSTTPRRRSARRSRSSRRSSCSTSATRCASARPRTRASRPSSIASASCGRARRRGLTHRIRSAAPIWRLTMIRWRAIGRPAAHRSAHDAPNPQRLSVQQCECPIGYSTIARIMPGHAMRRIAVAQVAFAPIRPSRTSQGRAAIRFRGLMTASAMPASSGTPSDADAGRTRLAPRRRRQGRPGGVRAALRRNARETVWRGAAYLAAGRSRRRGHAGHLSQDLAQRRRVRPAPRLADDLDGGDRPQPGDRPASARRARRRSRRSRRPWRSRATIRIRWRGGRSPTSCGGCSPAWAGSTKSGGASCCSRTIMAGAASSSRPGSTSR